jgi:hypothetical protein
MNRIFFLPIPYFLLSYRFTPFFTLGLFWRGNLEARSSLVFFVASIDSLIRFMTSSNEFIRVFGSVGAAGSSGIPTRDGDGKVIL